MVSEAKGTLRIYGCGGTGINIAKPFVKARSVDDLADIACSFMDASGSNLDEAAEGADTFIVKGLDGAGKIRGENYKQITGTIRQMITEHPPQDLNVVVFSGSGGTGSVIGPLLVGEMLRQDIPVIAMLIGTAESAKSCDNTLKTLQTLQGISAKYSKPVVMIYEQNSQEYPRSVVDEMSRERLTSIAALGSRNNAELDSQDLFNCMYWNRVSEVSARLSEMQIFSNSSDVMGLVDSPIATAHLLRDVDSPTPEVYPDYSATGYLPAGEGAVLETDLHFVVSVDGVSSIEAAIRKQLKVYEEMAAKRVTTETLDVQGDDLGMVL